MSSFSPAWFLRGPHAQTIWSRLARPRRAVPPFGGHVGFVAGAAPWNCEYWGEELAIEWLCSSGQRSPATHQEFGRLQAAPTEAGRPR